MALETGSYINDLVITNPVAADPKSQGDDHIRLIKSALKETLNGFTGAILVTAIDTGSAAAHVLTPSTALVGYTPSLCLLYKPAVTNTGAVTVNVSGLGAKSIKTIAGTDPGTGDLLAGAPLLLFYNGTNFITLAGSEFVSRSGNQSFAGNFAIGGSLSSGNTTINGTLGVTGATTLQAATGLTRSPGDNTTNFATTAFVTAAAALLATLNSPAFTGVPTAPTASTGTSTNQIATTAYVTAVSLTSVLPGQTGNAGKYISTDGTNASWQTPNFVTPAQLTTAITTTKDDAMAFAIAF